MDTQIGVLVREAREAIGMSQAALARALGVSSSYLSSLERGRRSRDPRLSTLRSIAQVLGSAFTARLGAWLEGE